MQHKAVNWVIGWSIWHLEDTFVAVWRITVSRLAEIYGPEKEEEDSLCYAANLWTPFENTKMKIIFVISAQHGSIRWKENDDTTWSQLFSRQFNDPLRLSVIKKKTLVHYDTTHGSDCERLKEVSQRLHVSTTPVTEQGSPHFNFNFIKNDLLTDSCHYLWRKQDASELQHGCDSNSQKLRRREEGSQWWRDSVGVFAV